MRILFVAEQTLAEAMRPVFEEDDVLAEVADSAELAQARIQAGEYDAVLIDQAVLPSQCNFILVGVGARDGRQLYDRLLRKGVIVRPMNAYGLPHHLRVTVGTAEENARLLAALRETL